MVIDDGRETDIKERARQLRRQGLSLTQIAAQLRLRSTSPVRRWVADIPAPAWTLRPRARDELRCRARQLRVDGRSLGEIATELGVAKSSASLWVRDIPVPEGLRERAAHAHRINSERWLRDRARRESERQQVPHAWWSQVTGIPIDRFDRPTLKRHNPRTVRLNVGAGYHGCLVISVCKSRVLYQQIDGFFHGIVAGVEASSSETEPQSGTG